MSRVGKQPISLPKGVEVTVANGLLTVKGPKGTLQQLLREEVQLHIADGAVQVEIKKGYENAGHFHGLMRALIQNMIHGVSQGFEQLLEMVGVGYRAAVKGHALDLQVGFSHPTELHIPEGLQVKVEKNTTIAISGADRQKVGQFAAVVRAVRPPEPYQGKGIRRKGEHVRKKEGKTAAAKK